MIAAPKPAPEDALAVMGDMSPAAYPQLKARIIPALTSKNKVDEIRLANELAGPRISSAGSRTSAWVVPTNEELMIARHTRQLLAL